MVGAAPDTAQRWLPEQSESVWHDVTAESPLQAALEIAPGSATSHTQRRARCFTKESV